MTPERERYLAKCSDRELFIRDWIELQKANTKAYKADFKNNPIRARRFLQITKYELVAYRHELQRLKGMDRVVVPRRPEGYIGVLVCKCGSDVIANYCPNCGRRILWEKVSK